MSTKLPKLLYANSHGEVMEHPEFLAVGRTADWITTIESEEWIPLPEGAELSWLPGTYAVGRHPKTDEMLRLPNDVFAVGALLPQGYTRLLLPGYSKRKNEQVTLPLFGYTAVGWMDGQFYVAAHPTDDPTEWNPATINEKELHQLVEDTLSQYPENRLFQHLSHCALEYGCMTARNTFLSKSEGAVPASMVCNAACVGCISEQPDDSPFPAPQTRLQFRPTAEEMAQVMLVHIQKNPNAIVSFGQGCEGEPSTRFMDIANAIRKLRQKTNNGYININTNAGFVRGIQKIVDAGLDLMRVSIISAIPEHYQAYYLPRNYSLDDVATSLCYASEQGVYTSINYLVFPGISDREEEVEAMIQFLRRTKVKLVQMRNLNIDPDYYLQRIPEPGGGWLGMLGMMEALRSECPGLEIGSFTHRPPQRRILQH
ncbi:radical SAM protein [Alicyclobacillus tolerans]|uniref:Pyruvate-formate lyase-activating enzyme n=1 Tax=Alicyclobacillus tolerans TaxID=90970 RepID=A0ABT9LU34_9BACL|nr:radical SAM protein [Alicyclobacillus tengchongensis]MDP9727781.1 pyruvate-formate lyase-activating enzyme [Alicyclobacillus tengchongensis]